jgi:hypothetical protein
MTTSKTTKKPMEVSDDEMEVHPMRPSIGERPWSDSESTAGTSLPQDVKVTKKSTGKKSKSRAEKARIPAQSRSLWAVLGTKGNRRMPVADC